MLRLLKSLGLCVLAVVTVWYGVAVVMWLAVPSVPKTASLTGAGTVPLVDVIRPLVTDSRALVDRQWKRDGAVPTDEDKAEFEKLIARTDAQDKPEFRAELARNYKSLEAARERRAEVEGVASKALLRIESVAGKRIALSVRDFLFQPHVVVQNYRAGYLQDRQFLLRAPSRLASELRIHYAMALVLAGDKSGTRKELMEIMRKDLDLALIDVIYSIAGRADAQEDPDFRQLFDSIGGSSAAIKTDYTGEHAHKLSPFLVPDDVRFHYTER